MKPVRNRVCILTDGPELPVQQPHPFLQGDHFAGGGIVAAHQKRPLPAGDFQTAIFHILLPGLVGIERDMAVCVLLMNSCFSLKPHFVKVVGHLGDDP